MPVHYQEKNLSCFYFDKSRPTSAISPLPGVGMISGSDKKKYISIYSFLAASISLSGNSCGLD